MAERFQSIPDALRKRRNVARVPFEVTFYVSQDTADQIDEIIEKASGSITPRKLSQIKHLANSDPNKRDLIKIIYISHRRTS